MSSSRINSIKKTVVLAMKDIKNIIESLLFVSEKPLLIDQIKNIITGAEIKDIQDSLSALLDEYESRKGGFHLCEVAGGYQIRSRPEYSYWIKQLIKPASHRLSMAALETLTIIAYRGPVIRNEIEHIRGVDCGGIIRMLLEKKLVRIVGRKKIPGRPLLYATTRQFLELFGLKDRKDLPTQKEIEEISAIKHK